VDPSIKLISHKNTRWRRKGADFVLAYIFFCIRWLNIPVNLKKSCLYAWYWGVPTSFVITQYVQCICGVSVTWVIEFRYLGWVVNWSWVMVSLGGVYILMGAFSGSYCISMCGSWHDDVVHQSVCLSLTLCTVVLRSAYGVECCTV